MLSQGGYRVITSKSDRITYYRDKIAEKIFSLKDEDRKIYARLLIKEINANNPMDRMVEKEITVSEEEEYQLVRIINENVKYS